MNAKCSNALDPERTPIPPRLSNSDRLIIDALLGHIDEWEHDPEKSGERARKAIAVEIERKAERARRRSEAEIAAAVDFDELRERVRGGDFAGLGEAVDRMTRSEPDTRWAVPTDAYWAAPGHSPEFLVPRYLPFRLSLLTGKGGLGKSKLALMLGVSVACEGEPWLRAPHGESLVAPESAEAVAIYASWEETRDIARWRLCDWPRAAGDFAETLPALLGNRLDFRPLQAPLWAAPEGKFSLPTVTETGQRLLEYAKRREARLLIIDPLAAAYAGSENDRGQVRRFCAWLDAWAMKTRCAVLLVGHPPKTAAADYSGSTDWHNAPRAVLKLEVNGEGQTEPTLRHLKSNLGPLEPDLHLMDWRWWTAERGVSTGTDYRRAVLDYLTDKPDGATKTTIREQVTGQGAAIGKAIEKLLKSGEVEQPAGERTRIKLPFHRSPAFPLAGTDIRSGP